MTWIRTRARGAITSAAIALGVVTCTIADLPSEDGLCPCAQGYTCDDASQRCVLGDVASATSASSSRASTASSSTTSTSSAGGSGDGGAGGAGQGGQGVGACGGASPWQMNDGTDWATYTCAAVAPDCVVQSDGVLCCDNVHPIDARTAPSAESPFAGTLDSSYSWFVCWVRGEAQENGDATWFYTSLDSPPGNWGYVAGSALEPDGASTFDPADPSTSTLPECPCP
ncbi:MAG TPA: hypothetical protein VGM56_04325 [Byssovorax sp.]|jgi:hypothetical protein